MPDDPQNPSKKVEDKTGMYTFGRYLSVGLMIPVATMVGYGAGYEIDKHMGTHYWAMILMILGTVGGFVQLIREVTRG